MTSKKKYGIKFGPLLNYQAGQYQDQIHVFQRSSWHQCELGYEVKNQLEVTKIVQAGENEWENQDYYRKDQRRQNRIAVWKIKEMRMMSLLFKGCEDILNYDLQEAGLSGTWEYIRYFLNFKKWL